MDLVRCWNSGRRASRAGTEWHRDETSPKDPTPPTHATGLHTNLLIHQKHPTAEEHRTPKEVINLALNLFYISAPFPIIGT